MQTAKWRSVVENIKACHTRLWREAQQGYSVLTLGVTGATWIVQLGASPYISTPADECIVSKTLTGHANEW